MELREKHDLISQISELPKGDRARFWALVAQHLTVSARADAYPGQVDSDKDPAKLLKAFNEMQHLIVSHVAKLLAGDARIPTEQDLLKTIFEHAARAGLELSVEWSLRQALSA